MIAERWTDRVEDSANAAVESAAEGQKEAMDAAGIQLPEILESYVLEMASKAPRKFWTVQEYISRQGNKWRM